MGTKWNALPFRPGLVGGHCIGIDPYYLSYKATKSGYIPDLILASRHINDGIGGHVASKLIKSLIQSGNQVENSVITVLGLTFKENVSDIRNTRVVDILAELEDYGVEVQVHDPLAEPEELREEYGIESTEKSALKKADAVVLAVSHREYLDGGWDYICDLLKDGRGVVFDVKAVLDRETIPDGVTLKRL